MGRLRFAMIGGFLGAGKTTTIARLAAMFRDRGHRIGIVSNDQAADLADTQNLGMRGFAVAEVPGACFCCKFDSLVDAIRSLEASERPDVILAEPVGSCTDLVATVVQSLRRFVPDVDVAPFAVVLKPSLARLALLGEREDSSSTVGYIFRKQLEEADAIVVNRADALSPPQLASLRDLVAARYPRTPILTASARTGQGFDGLFELLMQHGDFGRRVLDIDYDIYAEAEAELGWLNTTARLTTSVPFDLDELLVEIVDAIGGELGKAGAEISHVKTLGLADGRCGVANLIGTGLDAELSCASGHRTSEVDLVINARVAIDPSTLESAVRGAVTGVAQRHAGRFRFGKTSAFRPARPIPTHRFSNTI